MTPAELRALFPSAERYVFLNHAGMSPIARPVADAVHTALEELMSGDILLALRRHQKRQETLRTLLGRMLNIPPATLAFTRNTSHGLSLTAQGIPFQDGDSVVLPSLEYPSNVYPWQAQEYRGVKINLVPARPNGLIAEEDLMAACDTTTRVLSVSWVQWGTGQRLDLERLGAFCRERGILFVVDIVQGCGALRLDLSALPIDVAAAGCHKWLLSPGGLGFLYVRPEVFQTFLPVGIGWNSVVNAIDWDRLHFEDLKPTPDRMEEGTPSLLATAALFQTVQLLEAVGFDTVNDQVLRLAAFARTQLIERGMQVKSPADPAQASGIVAFTHPTQKNEVVLAALTAANVTAAIRQGNLRFSPHAYNTEDDILRAIAAIPS